MADNTTIKNATDTVVTIGSDEVTIDTIIQQIQRMKLYDGSNGGTTPATMFPAGFLRVTDEPVQVFYDPFEGTTVDANLWTGTTSGAGSSSITNGVFTASTGTTVNGFSRNVSVPTFKLPIPAWMGFSFAIALPDGAAPIANTYRYWGSGTIPASPTATAPVTDGAGFELGVDGKLRAVVYANGTRILNVDLSTTGANKQPLDANGHRYIVYIRTDKIWWYIDGIADANLVATTTAAFETPASQVLPISFIAVAGSVAPASSASIRVFGAAVWDTGKNTTQISDGTYPHRKAMITRTGSIMVDTSGNFLFRGRANAFRAPGRAGTTGQKLLSLYNNAGSSVSVRITHVTVDLAVTVIKAITVLPPTIRLYKVTVAPTNGTAMLKNKIGGSAATSNASVVALNDASADGTSSATALTATLPAGAIITQEYAPRFITAAGYEPADRIEFLPNSDVILAAGEGVVLALDYTLATQNPTTDMWIAGIEWVEE